MQSAPEPVIRNPLPGFRIFPPEEHGYRTTPRGSPPCCSVPFSASVRPDFLQRTRGPGRSGHLSCCHGLSVILLSDNCCI